MKKSFLDDKYRPTGESILKESKIAIICGAIGLVLYAIMVYLSYHAGGNGGRYLGFIGWLLLFASILGEYFTVVGLQQPGGKLIAKYLGGLLNAIVIIIMIGMFIQGIL